MTVEARRVSECLLGGYVFFFPLALKKGTRINWSLGPSMDDMKGTILLCHTYSIIRPLV